jgi:small neutral amino acid transporter SnatA (MarC family)
MELNAREAFLLLFATIWPLKVTIASALLTATSSPEFIRIVAFRSVVTASTVCIVFEVLGEAILRVFHVSVPAF